MDNDQDKIEEAAHWVKHARALLVTAGAGMGVDSGLPDFRGPEGFWRAYPALGAAGLNFQDIASPHAFAARPALAWGFYGHRLALYRRTRPHAGFEILRRWAEGMPEGYRVFTSNVDGHFQRAGFAPETVHECHGSIHVLQCLEPCCERIWSADGFTPEIDEANCLLLNEPPKCPYCAGMARPNILMFDDYAWVDPPTAESRARLDAWIGARNDILVIEVGAGTEIPTARRFGERQATQLIRINARQAGVRGGKHNMGLAGAALDTLVAIEEVASRL
ncbi:Sir2 family NAD-dependent protein deacetylase [Cupriavidus basilensis]|uniref:protein acetyllysine N-acetyltransferase n=1 Tax=Cupriavidus basilensis TaxID=68895 RepID=A0ABT6AWD6_9BURK|nr:Sir2 family NAD-dependent protein deacetylase [Cupriavidus basilensis]MDF3836946.1 Sir2 family NAD-dependent protein deacetylase [Cupriavidus basilensis]